MKSGYVSLDSTWNKVMNVLPMGAAVNSGPYHTHTHILDRYELYTFSMIMLRKHGMQKIDAGVLQVRSRKMGVPLCVCDCVWDVSSALFLGRRAVEGLCRYVD